MTADSRPHPAPSAAEVRRFVHRPTEVEAMLYTVKSCVAIHDWLGIEHEDIDGMDDEERDSLCSAGIEVRARDGWPDAEVGQWIIRYPSGLCDVVDDADFTATYVPPAELSPVGGLSEAEGRLVRSLRSQAADQLGGAWARDVADLIAIIDRLDSLLAPPGPQREQENERETAFSLQSGAANESDVEVPGPQREGLAEEERLRQERMAQWDENLVWLDGAWWEVEHYHTPTERVPAEVSIAAGTSDTDAVAILHRLVPPPAAPPEGEDG